MELIKETGNWVNKLKNYFKETEIESRKVIWPEKKYVFVATVIVLVIVFLSSIYVLLIDYGFVKLFDFLTLIFKSRI